MAVFQFHLKNAVGGPLEGWKNSSRTRVIFLGDWPPGDAGPMSFPLLGFWPAWARILKATAESTLESSWGKIPFFRIWCSTSFCLFQLVPVFSSHVAKHYLPSRRLIVPSSPGWTTLCCLSHFSNEVFRGLHHSGCGDPVILKNS